MEINFKTMQKYLEERYNKVEEKVMFHDKIYYYYDMRGKVAAVEENDMITMYYDVPQELVETEYGKLSVSVIDNFIIVDENKTSLINAMYITPVTSNRNYIKKEKKCIIKPEFVFELHKKRFSLGTVGILEQNQDNKYHLTNDDFDIEFTNKKLLEPNSMENFKIIALKELKTSENNDDIEKINLNEVYDYYFDYFKPSKVYEDLLFDLRDRKIKTYDLLETVTVRNTKEIPNAEKKPKVKTYILKW